MIGEVLVKKLRRVLVFRAWLGLAQLRRSCVLQGWLVYRRLKLKETFGCAATAANPDAKQSLPPLPRRTQPLPLTALICARIEFRLTINAASFRFRFRRASELTT